MSKIIRFGELDYIVKEEEKNIMLESTTKNKYGYKKIIQFPKEDDGNSFQEIIEEFLLKEIL